MSHQDDQILIKHFVSEQWNYKVYKQIVVNYFHACLFAVEQQCVVLQN